MPKNQPNFGSSKGQKGRFAHKAKSGSMSVKNYDPKNTMGSGGSGAGPSTGQPKTAPKPR